MIFTYRFYYNSCNLEHVLYNQLKDFSDEEKMEYYPMILLISMKEKFRIL